jgi:hypothetical protein
MNKRVAWSDDPLVDGSENKGIYFTELQQNTNFVQRIAGVTPGAFSNASAGQQFTKVAYDEIQDALSNTTLLEFYGYSSINEILGRDWSPLPQRGVDYMGGYDLINDMRRVIDAFMTSGNDDHAFELICEPDITRGVAFDLKIQSYSTEDGSYGSLDLTYVPTSHVYIYLSASTDSDEIVPTQIDNTGWTNGARTISCTITGGDGKDTVFIGARDASDNRTGKVQVALNCDATDVGAATETKYWCSRNENGWSAAFWGDAWNKARGALSGSTVDTTTGRTFLGCKGYAYGGLGCVRMHMQYSCYGNACHCEIRRTYLEFDISAYKGNVRAASLLFDNSSEYFIWDGVDDANDDEAGVAVYSMPTALTAAFKAQGFQNLLSGAQTGEFQSVLSFHEMKIMDADHDMIWFNLDPDIINNAGGDYIWLSVLGWDDYWNQMAAWPGNNAYGRPIADYAGDTILRVLT